VKPRIDQRSNPTRLVRTREGVAGRAEPLPDEAGRALVSLDDGRRIVVPEEMLERQQDGSYVLALPVEEISAPGREDYAVIPVMREELDIRKRMVETGRGVRIRKHVSEREEQVVQLLYREELDVQHVPVNQLVDRPLPVRYEGTTMVIPLCEEVLVVEKRLLLKEEVRVTRREAQVRHSENVVLRAEHATVERFDDETQHAREAGGATSRPPAR
jgi:uncharacterized protein (TIGR02271 family)